MAYISQIKTFDGVTYDVKDRTIHAGGVNLLPQGYADDNTTEWTSTYPSSGSYTDFYYYDAMPIPSTALEFTLSFEAKSTVDGDEVRSYFYSPNTTTETSNSQGFRQSASKDGWSTISLTTSWARYWITWKQSEGTTNKNLIIGRAVKGDGEGTVSIRAAKFEVGNAPTAWTPSKDLQLSTCGVSDENLVFYGQEY